MCNIKYCTFAERVTTLGAVLTAGWRPRRLREVQHLVHADWDPIALILSAAAGAPLLAAERGPVKSLLEMRRDRVVVQKWDLSCGVAALATILNYQHGDLIAERRSRGC